MSQKFHCSLCNQQVDNRNHSRHVSSCVRKLLDAEYIEDVKALAAPLKALRDARATCAHAFCPTDNGCFCSKCALFVPFVGPCMEDRGEPKKRKAEDEAQEWTVNVSPHLSLTTPFPFFFNCFPPNFISSHCESHVCFQTLFNFVKLQINKQLLMGRSQRPKSAVCKQCKSHSSTFRGCSTCRRGFRDVSPCGRSCIRRWCWIFGRWNKRCCSTRLDILISKTQTNANIQIKFSFCGTLPNSRPVFAHLTLANISFFNMNLTTQDLFFLSHVLHDHWKDRECIVSNLRECHLCNPIADESAHLEHLREYLKTQYISNEVFKACTGQDTRTTPKIPKQRTVQTVQKQTTAVTLKEKPRKRQAPQRLCTTSKTPFITWERSVRQTIKKMEKEEKEEKWCGTKEKSSSWVKPFCFQCFYHIVSRVWTWFRKCLEKQGRLK